MTPISELLVIDSSVFVASENPHEVQHADSLRFVVAVQDAGLPVACPTLCPVEVGAAIARPTGNVNLARDAANRVRRFPNLRLLSLTHDRAQQATQAAIRFRLRGADSVYVALAQEFGAIFITWDGDIITRTAGVVPVLSPTDWLAAAP